MLDSHSRASHHVSEWHSQICLRQGSFALGIERSRPTGGRSASAAPQSHLQKPRHPSLKRAIDMTEMSSQPSPQVPRFMWSSSPGSVIAKACLRQGSFAPGNPGMSTTGGRSASAAPQSHLQRRATTGGRSASAAPQSHFATMFKSHRPLQFSRGLPPVLWGKQEGSVRGIFKAWVKASTLGWLNRRHSPILTTTLPIFPSPADLLVA